MPRKATGFRLDEDLLVRMDAAVAAGVASNRTALIELAVERVLRGSEASADVRRSAAPSRPPAKERAQTARRVLEGDGAALPKIAPRRWASG